MKIDTVQYQAYQQKLDKTFRLKEDSDDAVNRLNKVISITDAIIKRK